MTAKLGVKNDGRIVGLDATVVAAAGAYPAIGAILPMLTQMMSVVTGVDPAEIRRINFLGVRHIDMPCTSERVWLAINAAR